MLSQPDEKFNRAKEIFGKFVSDKTNGVECLLISVDFSKYNNHFHISLMIRMLAAMEGFMGKTNISAFMKQTLRWFNYKKLLISEVIVSSLTKVILERHTCVTEYESYQKRYPHCMRMMEMLRRNQKDCKTGVIAMPYGFG